MRVLGLFARVCCLCESLHAFAIVCCKVAFHITVQCRLHVCLAFVLLFRLFVFVCLFWEWLCMCLPLYVASLRFMLHVCILHVCFALVCVVCLFVFVCIFRG